MQSKILSRILLSGIIMGCVLLLLLLLFVLSYLILHVSRDAIKSDSWPLSKNAIILLQQKQAHYGLPVRLEIPVINVNTVLEHVGITSNGAMGAPKGPANAGWFSLGTRPGEIGSAVIDGHYGWTNNIPAVFDDLHTLKKGDKLYIEDEGGTTITFIIRDVRSYDQNENIPMAFSSNDGKAHLNLITCGGIWDKTGQSYLRRIIVFSDKE